MNETKLGKLTRRNQALIWAANIGYKVINNQVYSHLGNKIKTRLENGYPRFTVRHNKKTAELRVHRLLGYIKFGDKIFDPNLQIRHLDGNKENNNWDNIDIGTCSQNQFDKPLEIRKRCAVHATSFVKIHDHEAIIKRRNEGASYKQLMQEFNISSKGTLSSIINKSIASKT